MARPNPPDTHLLIKRNLSTGWVKSLYYHLYSFLPFSSVYVNKSAVLNYATSNTQQSNTYKVYKTKLREHFNLLPSSSKLYFSSCRNLLIHASKFFSVALAREEQKGGWQKYNTNLKSLTTRTSYVDMCNVKRHESITRFLFVLTMYKLKTWRWSAMY